MRTYSKKVRLCTNISSYFVLQFQVVPAPVSDINFDNTNRPRKRLIQSDSSEAFPVPLSRDELLQELHQVHPTAAVFSGVPGFASAKNAHELEPNLPPLLTSLYDAKYTTYSEDNLENCIVLMYFLS